MKATRTNRLDQGSYEETKGHARIHGEQLDGEKEHIVPRLEAVKEVLERAVPAAQLSQCAEWRCAEIWGRFG